MALEISNRIAASDPGMTDAVAAAVNNDGYAIVTDVISADRCAELVAEVQTVEKAHDIAEGKNEFEGFSTRRIFDLIGKSELFRDLVVDPTVLAATESVLGEDMLLSGTTSMNIGPGETPQLLHSDDGMITLPRPHAATMITTLWALTEFRADNGATWLVPGSHQHKTNPKPGDTHEVGYAEMEPGSMLVLHGSTWHGGGANSTTDERRYGLSIQYVAGWCRQQQNLMLGTPPEVVASYPRRLQELIGYTLYRNVMGHVNREHPLTLLGVEEKPDMVWERLKTEAP